MPIDLTGTNAATEKDKRAKSPVYLAKIILTEPGRPTKTLYYGTEKYVLGGITYEGKLSKDGIQFGAARLRPEGGLAESSTVDIEIADGGKESGFEREYYTAYDEVFLYKIFATGSETVTDLIETWCGQIATTQAGGKGWQVQCVNGVVAAMRPFPTERATLEKYKSLPLPNNEKPLPLSLGTFQESGESSDDPPFVMPLLAIEKHRYHTGGHRVATEPTFMIEYYPNAGVWALGGFLSINHDASEPILDLKGSAGQELERQKTIYPSVSGFNNTVADWHLAASPNTTTKVTVTTTDTLELFFDDLPTLGVLSQLNFDITKNGTVDYDYTLKHLGSTVSSGTNQTGNKSVSLSLTPHANGWTLGGYVLTITANADSDFSQIRMVATFDSGLRYDSRPPAMFIAGGRGRNDSVIEYNSTGASNPAIAGGSADIKHPVDQLEYLLRAKDVLNQSYDKINGTAFDTAKTARSNWEFGFTLLSQVNAETWLNEFGFQAGLHIFLNHAGQWTPVAQDKDATPVRFIHYSHCIAGTARTDKTAVDDVINDVYLHYWYNQMNDVYQRAEVRTGLYALTGSGTVAGAVLTDAGADFSDIPEGWHVVLKDSNGVFKEVQYEIDTGGTTTLTLDTSPGNATYDYYVGKGVHWKGIHSVERYGVNKSLGQAASDLTTNDGYKSKLIAPNESIAKNTTAAAFAEYAMDWFSEQWHTRHVETTLRHFDLELADPVLSLHPEWIEYKEIRATKLNGDHNASTGTLTLYTGEGTDNYVEGEYLRLNGEIVRVQTVGANSLTVVRNVMTSGVGYFRPLAGGSEHGNNTQLYRTAIKARSWGMTDTSTSLLGIFSGDGDNFEVGDYIVLEEEVMKVTSASASSVGVSRGEVGTTAVAHPNNAPVFILKKYFVTGKQPIPLHKVAFDLQEMPAP